jgi:hypothetical protein
VLLQVALAAIPLPWSYDRMVFEAAGYLVGTGGSPYAPHDLSAVFHAAAFHDFATIGYPPPWPLVLGGIYRAAHAATPDLQLYPLAIKLPVIAAGVGLAYLTGAALQNLGASPPAVRRAWLAILFNPFVVYVAAVRGQIDPIVAVLALAALLLVASRRFDLSALLLALAVCVKPIAAPLLLAALLAVGAASLPRALRYGAVFAAGLFGFYVLPFLVLGWSLAPLRAANAQISLAGAMSPATIARLWSDPLALQGHWWLLGLAWLPALLVALAVWRRAPRDATGLLALGVALTLVFFLLRTWLAETNIVLVLAPALVLVALRRLDGRLYTSLWLLPLTMTLLRLWPAKLLWAVAPQAVERVTAWAESWSFPQLAAQVAVIVAWQVAGWLTVVACFRGRPRPGLTALSIPAAAARSSEVAVGRRGQERLP